MPIKSAENFRHEDVCHEDVVIAPWHTLTSEYQHIEVA